MAMKNIVMDIKCGGNPNGNGYDCNVSVIANGAIVAIQAESIDRIKKSGKNR